MSENTHERAEAAIEALGGLDAALTGATASTTPDPFAAPVRPVQSVQAQKSGTTPEVRDSGRRPAWQEMERNESGQWVRQQPPAQPSETPPPTTEQQPQTQPQGDTSFMGESFDPNSLDPQLHMAYKQMQAHFTRTQQELQAERKQYEQFGDPSEIAQAVELRTMLSDPRNYAQLHSELAEYLKATGLSNAEASAEAHEQMRGTQESQGFPGLDEIQDPDLEPVKGAINSVQKELAELRQVKDEFSQWRQQQEAREMEMRMVGQIQQQVAAVRNEHPEYTDADVDAIFELATYHEGDILAAQRRYEDIFTDRMSRYLQSKTAPASIPTSFGGQGTTTAQPSKPTSTQDALAAALEIAAQIDGQRS